jgi:hypothetical protein
VKDVDRDPDDAAKARGAIDEVGRKTIEGSKGPGDNNPIEGQLPGTAGKVVGGGLQAGSTDFGAPTAAATGGRTGFGTDTGRNDTSGGGPTPGAGASAPGIGAAGDTVNAVGRSMQSDSHQTIGGAILPTPPARDVEDDLGQEPGSTAREAAGTSGVGTIGGGTMGKPTSGQRGRANDVIEPRNPTVAGSLPGGEPGEGFKSASKGTPETDEDIDRGKS